MTIQRSGVALIVLTMLVGACSGGDGEDEGSVAAQTEPATENEGEGAAPTDTPPDDGGAGVEEFDPSDILAEQTVSLQANPDDKVTLAVQSLKVEGSAMTLRMVVTPHFTSVSEGETVTLYDVWETRRFSPTLIDLDNLKEYSVITAGERSWTSEPGDTWVVNGEPMLAWAVFAAPEDDIETVEVRVTEWWPPFTDVPVER